MKLWNAALDAISVPVEDAALSLLERFWPAVLVVVVVVVIVTAVIIRKRRK